MKNNIKFLIIFLLLTSICFAQGAWQYKSVVETWQDIAGKYRTKVLITDGEKEECIILKFQKQPTISQIKEETQKFCFNLNNPTLPEPSVEELKEIIKEKDIKIAELETKLQSMEKEIL